jgi:hypothetical protein
LGNGAEDDLACIILCKEIVAAKLKKKKKKNKKKMAIFGAFRERFSQHILKAAGAREKHLSRVYAAAPEIPCAVPINATPPRRMPFRLSYVSLRT